MGLALSVETSCSVHRDRQLIAPGGTVLEASLQGPPQPWALVLVAHGSGSNRFSPRNRAVAARLQREGVATMLLDLLTPEELSRDREHGSLGLSIPLLGERLVAAIDWVASQPDLAGLPLGLFGASTGAAAALRAAALRPRVTRAVVCRGGRPDLAPAALPLVRCPVLLIVGDRDRDVLRLNRLAASRMQAPHRLALVAGAGHLFEEAGALEEVGELAAEWFRAHLGAARAERASHFHT